MSHPLFFCPTLVDGINDVAIFGPAAEKVEIFDVKGRRVFRAKRQGDSAIQWNCRDQNGNIVESGVYIGKIKTSGGKVHQTFAVVK